MLLVEKDIISVTQLQILPDKITTRQKDIPTGGMVAQMLWE